ncbi:CTD-3088G3.8 [Branchiostoma lanceolatum]|uniref:CTD-3088G3.8 protein n=1 Tax=Branchiostoma lanceolatum TaxID=7740 RepID=A0A8K0ECK4_BRALA|nr:CTD-3088G3.8 [Branchiostoma lanceolatum]CAH1244203.1 CTD-3088G3.8 [Branchiostoma lanceolatum]CAH1244204.1 CTD-3088G3.8 [Branchiostoma lanceolatum]CAH1244205.1 CTD-3088G3.8 [Branchiostoma lanceolatum]
MELRTVVLFALVAGGFSVPLSSVTDDQCSRHCTESNVLDYRIGRTYRYKYDAKTTTQLVGSSDETSGLEIAATVDLEVLSKCELVLRLSDVDLKEASRQALMVTSSNKREFQRALERHPLRFSFQDGIVPEICPSAEDEPWVVNIKRGVLSALQNSYLSQRRTDMEETDVTGACDVQYEPVDERGLTTQYRRTRTFQRCSDRRLGSETGIQANFYHKQTERPHILDSNQECTHTIDSNSLIESVTCTERHLLRPFSHGQNGATVRSTQKLQLTPQRPRTKSSLLSGLGFIRSDLRFQHDSDDSQSASGRVEQTLRDLCAQTAEGVRPETPALFSRLVYQMRDMNVQEMRSVIARAEGICNSDPEKMKKFAMDAVPLVHNEASARLVKEYIMKGEVTGEQADAWLAAQVFAKNPTPQMIAELQPLCEGREVRRSAYLSLSALIHKYCQAESDCAQRPEIRNALAVFERNLGERCHSFSDKEEEKVMMSLKAIGNAGQAVSAAPTLSQCVLTDANPISVRRAAMEAFRRLPCTVSRTALTNTFMNKEEDSEVRIAAYIQAALCPSHDFFQIVKRAMDSEESSQVGSYVWSHLQQLQKRHDEFHNTVSDILRNSELEKKFTGDKRKFSSAWEGSVFSDRWNMGGEAQADLIFSDTSFVPRSARLNLTAMVFGAEFNMLEMGGRIEGLSYLVESFFGHQGYFPENNVLHLLKTKEKRSVLKENKLEEVHRKFNAKQENQPEGSYYVRMYGDEMMYGDFKGLDIQAQKQGWNVMEMMMKLAKQQDYEVTKSTMFLDSTHTIPTSTGLPLRLAINGTATTHVKVSGKMDVRNMGFSPRSMHIEGQVMPSAAVEISSELGIDAHVARCGMKMTTTLHSSTFADGKIILKKGSDLEVKLNMPRDKMEIVNVQSKLFLINQDQEREVRGVEADRVDESACTGTWGIETFGLQMCGEVQYPNPRLEDETPYVPLTGPMSASITLNKADAGLDSYVMEARYNIKPSRVNGKKENTYSMHFLLDTPGSRIDRKMELNAGLNIAGKAAEFSMQHPKKTISFNGNYNDQAETKSVNLDLTIDEKDQYTLKGEMMVEELQGNWRYMPSLEIKVPQMKTVSANGVVGFEQDRKAELTMTLQGIKAEDIVFATSMEKTLKDDKKSYSMDMQMKYPEIIDASLEAEMLGKDKVWTHVLKAEYSLFDQKKETIELNQRLRDLRTEDLMKFVATHDFKFSCFPDFQHKLSVNHENHEKMAKSGIQFDYGKDAFRENNLKRLSLSSLITDGSDRSKYMYDAELQVEHPEQGIDAEMAFHHQHSMGLITDLNTKLTVTYDKEKEPVLVQITYKNDTENNNKLMKMGGGLTLFTPMSRMRLAEDIEETAAMEYKAVSTIQLEQGAQWQVDKTLKWHEDKKDGSIRVFVPNSDEQTLFRAETNFMNKQDGFTVHGEMETIQTALSMVDLVYTNQLDKHETNLHLKMPQMEIKNDFILDIGEMKSVSMNTQWTEAQKEEWLGVEVHGSFDNKNTGKSKEQRHVVNFGVSQKKGRETRQMDVNADVFYTPYKVYGGEVSFEHKGNDKTNKLYKTIVSSKLNMPERKMDLKVEQPYDCDICEGLKMPKKVEITGLSQDKGENKLHFKLDGMVDDSQPISLEFNSMNEIQGRGLRFSQQSDASLEFRHGLKLPAYIPIPRQMSLTGMNKFELGNLNGKVEFTMHETQKVTLEHEYKMHRHHTGTNRHEMTLTASHSIPDMPVPASNKLYVKIEPKSLQDVAFKTEVTYGSSDATLDVTYKGKHQNDWTHDVTVKTAHSFDMEVPKDMQMDLRVEKNGMSGEGKLEFSSKSKSWTASLEGKSDNTVSRDGSFNVGMEMTFLHGIPEMMELGVPGKIELTNKNELKWGGEKKEYQTTLELKFDGKFFKQQIDWSGPGAYMEGGRHEVNCVYTHLIDVTPQEYRMDAIIERNDPLNYMEDISLTWDGRKQYHLVRKMAHTVENGNDVYTFTEKVVQPINLEMPEHDTTWRLVLNQDSFPQEMSLDFNYVDVDANKKNMNTKTTYEGPLPTAFEGHHELHFTMNHPWEEIPIPRVSSVDWTIDSDEVKLYDSKYAMSWDGEQMVLNKLVQRSQTKKHDMYTVSFDMQQPFEFLAKKTEGSAMVQLEKTTQFPTKITTELKAQTETFLDMQVTYDGPLPEETAGHHELHFTLAHKFELPIPEEVALDWIADSSEATPYAGDFSMTWDGMRQIHMVKSFKKITEGRNMVYVMSETLDHPFDFLPSRIEASGRYGMDQATYMFREISMDLKYSGMTFETAVKLDGSPTTSKLTVRVNQPWSTDIPTETMVELSQEVKVKVGMTQSIKITCDKAMKFEANREFEKTSSGYTHNIKVNLPAIRLDSYGRQQISFDIEHEDKMQNGERNVEGSVSFRHPFTTYVPFRDMATSYDLKQTYRTVQANLNTNWDDKDGVKLEVKFNNKTLGSTYRYDSLYIVTQPFTKTFNKLQFSDQYQMDMPNSQMKNLDYKWTTVWDETNTMTGGYGYVDQSDRQMNKHWFYNNLEHPFDYSPKKMTLQGHVEYEKKGQPKRGSKVELEWDDQKMSMQGSYRDNSNNRQQDHELVLRLEHPFDVPVACYGQLSRDIELTQQLKWRRGSVEHYTGVEFKDKIPRQVYSLEGEHTMNSRKGEVLNSQLKYRYDSNPRNELVMVTYMKAEGGHRAMKHNMGFAVRHIDLPVINIDTTITLAARKTDVALRWGGNKEPWTLNFHVDHETNLFEAKLDSPVLGRGYTFEMRMDEDSQTKTYFMRGTSSLGDALFFKTQIFPEQKKIVFKHGHTVDSKEESLDIVMKYLNETAVSMEMYETEGEQRMQTFSEVVLRLITPEILASKIYYNPKTPEIVEDRLNNLIARFMQHHLMVVDNFKKAFDKETREWMSSSTKYGCTGTFFQGFIQKLRPAVLGDRKSVAAPTLEQLRKQYGLSGLSQRLMSALNTAADTVRQTYRSAMETVMRPMEDLKSYIEQNLMSDLYQKYDDKMADMSYNLRSKLTDSQREMLDRNEVQKSMHVMKSIAKEVGAEVASQMKKNWQRSMGVLPLPMMKTKIHQLNLVQGRIAADLHLPFKWHSFESMPQPYAQMMDVWENQILPMQNYSVWDTIYRYKPSSSNMVPPFMADALISGQQHFLTFDKKHFEFGGDCSYVLARDMIDGNFSVVLNYHSGASLQKKSLVVIIDEKTYEIFPSGVMKRENQDTELPLQDKNTAIRREGQRVVVENSNGVAVTCDLTHDLCNVQVSGWYFGKTAGLFGIYNNEVNDEFTMSDGAKTQDLLQFTNSWDVSKSCRKNRNKARTCAPGPQDSRAEGVCGQMFKDQSSPLRRCFNIVDVTPYHDMCKSDVCENQNSLHPETLPCNVTAAYIEQCRKAGVPLTMPSKCVTCQNPDGSVFHEGEQTRITDTRKVNTADIVVVVEEKSCNRRRAPQLTDLVQYLDTQLQRKGMKDNRFALVGYGGEGVHDASHTHTISGQLFHDARQFVLGVEKLEFGEGQNNDAFTSLRMAANYPFRTGAAKSIVILSCSEECQETQGDYKEISTMLKDRDITVHLLKDHRFRLRKTKDIERVTIYGLDRREVFTSKDVSRDFDKSSLLQYVKAPKDMCSALALETEGCIFDSNAINNKEFLDVYSRRVSGSVRPAPCQVCDCVQDSWGAPRSVCRKCDDSFSVDIPMFSFDESAKQARPVKSKPESDGKWWMLF